MKNQETIIQPVVLIYTLCMHRNTQGEPLGRYLDPMPKDLLAFKQALSEENIYTFVRPGGIIHSNPPFIITDEQIKEGFGKISRALSRTVDLTFQP